MSRSFTPHTYSASSSRMPAPPTDWDDLRQQARQLENEIDAKLMSFSKLCSNHLARDQSSRYLALDFSSTGISASFEAMSNDIEKLLERLSDINRRMTEAIPVLLGPNAAAATHTLQRHCEISQDYRREFERTKANMRNFQTREDLLMRTPANNHEPVSNGLNSRRQDHYARETDHLTHSHKLVDRALDAMTTIKDDLNKQRRYFHQISHKVNALSNRFPLMNSIMQKVKIKKRKDSLVLGFVIALCLILLLLYTFR